MNKLELLSVREVAELRGCSERYLRQEIARGFVTAQEIVNSKSRKKYLIPLSVLEPKLQRKYYQQHGKSIPDSLRQRKELQRAGPGKPLDTFSVEQRIEIER